MTDMRRFLAIAALSVLTLSQPPALAQSVQPTPTEPSIQIDRTEASVRVTASLRIEVHHHLAWEVLTDYDNLARYVLDMKSSRIVSAPGDPIILRQTGLSGFLFFNVPIEIVARLEEVALESIRFYTIGGNLKQMSGEWRVVRLDEATQIIYQANIVAGFWVPPLIGTGLIAEDVRKKLNGIAQEMRRRAARQARPVGASTKPKLRLAVTIVDVSATHAGIQYVRI